MTDVAGRPESALLTPHVALRRVEIVVNPMSGGTGPEAATEARDLLRAYELEANVVEAEPPRVEAAIEAAFATNPDVVFVLAGDGTARTAAAMAGLDGPLVSPLPGGTMNLLPKALYGTADWRVALHRALTEGLERTVSGGEVAGRPFYCAAVLGSPALWAPAREAVRNRRPTLAYLHARRAMRRAFTTRVRFKLDGEEFHRAEALGLLCPLISKAMDEPTGLEAALIKPSRAAEVFRLAATAVFSDWRDDASVETRVIQRVDAWSRQRIPAILDGEPVQLQPEVEVKFLPVAFRALAPARDLSPAGGSA